MVLVVARKRLGECIGGSADEHRPRTTLAASAPASPWVDVPSTDTHPDEQPIGAVPHPIAAVDPIADGDPDVEQVSVRDEHPVARAHHHVAHAADPAGETHLTGRCGEDGFTTLGTVFDATSTRAVRAWRFTKLADDVEVRGQSDATRDGESSEDQATSWLRMRERNCNTAREWICEIRLSVTPSTSPISASVRFSS